MQPPKPEIAVEHGSAEEVGIGLSESGMARGPIDPRILVERQEPRRLLWLALIAGGVLAFVGLSRLATGDAPHAFDDRILLMFRHKDDLSTPIGPHWLLEMVRDYTTLAGWPVLTLFTVFLSGYLALRRKWGTMLLVICAVVGESILVDLLKGIFGRERPGVVPHLIEASNFSFPSGHSASAAAVYLTMGVVIARASDRHSVRVYVITVAILLALLIGVSRVYLGVHYPTDVAAGLAIGSAWAAFVWLAAYYIDHWFGSFGKGTRT